MTVIALLLVAVVPRQEAGEPRPPRSRAMLTYDFRDTSEEGEYDAVAWAGAQPVGEIVWTDSPSRTRSTAAPSSWRRPFR